MKIRRPSDTEVSEYVYVMTSIPVVGRRMSEGERLGYQLAAKFVQQAGPEPLDLCELHRLMYPGDVMAGQFRKGAVLEMSAAECRPKAVPRSATIADLVGLFRQGYEQALVSDVASATRCKPRTLAWYLAAFGRCVRPFARGSRFVFFLIENHLLQMYGERWRSKLVPQRAFRHFRENAFNKMCTSQLVYA